MDHVELQHEVLVLRRRNRKLLALLRLLLALLRLSSFKINDNRLPDGSAKTVLLKAIERSRQALPLMAVLRVLGYYEAAAQARSGVEQ